MVMVRSRPIVPTRLPRAGREAMVAVAVAAFGALIIGMWWRDTPPGSLHTFGALLVAAGDLTGLLGTYLILVGVVLMARVPWLDRLIGMDRLALWHRLIGQYSLSLLVAHAGLTIWGYAVADHAGPVAETKSVILSYPDMLAATVGLAIFAAIGATSARAARRRLKYQTWYFVHLYAYLALALSFAHQLATGTDFATHTLNRALWILLYLAAATAVIGWRVVVPIRHASARRLRVANVVREGPNTVSIYVTGDLAAIDAEPGQFFLWRFLTRDGWWQAHPYSLSAAPNAKWLRLTAKELGDHSRTLAHVRRGTRVIAEGPYGAFTGRRQTRPGVAMIAGGIGITPLRAMFETLPARAGELDLIYRASSEEDVVFRDELAKIAAWRDANVHYVIGSRTQRPDALSPRHILDLIPDISGRDVFVCGPTGMVETVAASLRDLGIPRRHIHVEEFSY